MKWTSTYLPIAHLDDLIEDTPAPAEADGIDLVLVRRGSRVHVFEGRCPHRGALLADGRVDGPNLGRYGVDGALSASSGLEGSADHLDERADQGW